MLIVRFLLSLIILIPFGFLFVWLKLALWPYVLAYGYLVPWVLGGCIVLLIINSLINGEDNAK